METLKSDQTKFTGVELAYPIALATYETAQKRLDVIDTRIQTLLGIGVTISLPIPVLVRAGFQSKWFYAAVVCFVTALIVGSVARLRGHIMLPHPTELYDKWLHYSDWEFKKNLIYFAGQHYEANRLLAEQRGRLAAITAVLFLVELVLLAVWASLLRP